MDALSHFSLRASAGRPGRTLLTILSVVFGVMTVVAVANASRTTREAYKEMFGAVTGKASLEISRAGDEGFPQETIALIEGLRDSKGKSLVQTAAPLVAKECMLRISGKSIYTQVLGIDPTRDRLVRDIAIVSGKELAENEDILLDESFAKTMEISIGDTVRLVGSRSGLLSFRVSGLVAPKAGAAIRLGGMAFITLPAAQHGFEKEGKLDRIQIVTAPDVDPKTVRAVIEPLLEGGVQIDLPQDTSAVMKETSMSSEEGIKLSRYFTLLLAVFIITNTFLMNLGERRQQLAVIRAIGGTRWQIISMMVREGLALAVLGSVVGIACGYGLAVLLNLGLSRLYQVSLPPLPFSLEPIILGFTFGICTVLIAVVIPAYLSTLVTPLEGMRNVARTTSSRLTKWMFGLGIAVNLICGILVLLSIQGKISIEVASPAGVLMVFGAVLLCPGFMPPLARLVGGLLKLHSRIEADMAIRQLLRHQLRTSLTMGVLFVAGSTGIGMSSAILDSINDVKEWRNVAIQGDYFIRATKPNMAKGTAPDLPDQIVADLRSLPGVKSIDTAIQIQAQVGAASAIVIAREYAGKVHPPFDLIEGDKETLFEKLKAGDVVIGTVLAEREKYKLGDMLPILGKDGPEKRRIAGIANDYLAGGLTVHIYREQALKLLGVYGYDAVLVDVEKGQAATVLPKIQELCHEHGVIVQSYTDITKMIDGMILVIDACMWGMVVLGYVVASFGVVNTLTMNVLEQTREIGLLRITGMTRKQVRRTVLMQAIILGAIGATPGIIAGLGTAYLINLAMMPSLGHPVQLQFHPFLIMFSWVGSMVIVLLAALFPALRASRISVVNALHYE